MQQPHRLALVLISSLLGACSGHGDTPDQPDHPDGSPPPIDGDSGAVPRVETVPCRFDVAASLGLHEGVGYACGDLIVEENRATPGRHIRLHYVRIVSPATTHRATIYLDGGPGGDGQGILDYAAYLGSSFLDGLMVDGDFLVLGQRGTGRSIPYLDCQEAGCADYAAIADLTAYNTASNADDVDDLRAALGLDQLDVYGISYGSRLGLEVLRRHGDHVRAAVIEGLVPAQVVWPAEIPASFYGALSGLSASCADAGACGTAFGDLVGKFTAGVQTLTTNPVQIQVAGNAVDLDGTTYASLLFQMMYSRSSYAWLPLVINDLAVRRTDRITSFLARWLDVAGGGGGGISTGLYYSVVCGEMFSPPAPNAFELANANVPPSIVDIFGGSYFGMVDVCKSWPVSNLEAQLNPPVTSSVRTLVSSGRLDPITPPRFGALAAATLSDSVHVVHANSGHGATLQSPCGMHNLLDFLADPTTPHDTSCAAAITTAYMLPGLSLLARPIPPQELIRLDLGIAPIPPVIRDRVRRAVAHPSPAR